MPDLAVYTGNIFAKCPDTFEYQHPTIHPYFTDSGVRQLKYTLNKLESLKLKIFKDQFAFKNATRAIESFIHIVADLFLHAKSRRNIRKQIETLCVRLKAILPLQHGTPALDEPYLLEAVYITSQGLSGLSLRDVKSPRLFTVNTIHELGDVLTEINSATHMLGALANIFTPLKYNALQSESLFLKFQSLGCENRSVGALLFRAIPLNGKKEVKYIPSGFWQMAACDLHDEQSIVTYRQSWPVSISSDSAATASIKFVETLLDIIADLKSKDYDIPVLTPKPATSKPLAYFNYILSLTSIPEGYLCSSNADFKITLVSSAIFYKLIKAAENEIKLLNQLIQEKWITPEQAEIIANYHQRLIFELHNLKNLKENKQPQLSRTFKDPLPKVLAMLRAYQQGDTTNPTKREICQNLIANLENFSNKHNTDENVILSLEESFSDLLKLFLMAYNYHNQYCIEHNKSIGRLGPILDQALNIFSNALIQATCKDSLNYAKACEKLAALPNQFLNPLNENVSSLRVKRHA